MLPRHLENGKSYPNPQKRFEGRHLQLSPHINFNNNLLSALNKGNQIGLLLIDLCKAFDLVDHDLLIKKLEIYKCNHASLQWFKSYLNNREQLVEINGTKSDPLKIKSGVP